MGMQGSLSDMTVMDLIQHNCQEQKSSQLTLNHAGEQAVIYFQDGNIAHAVYGQQKGEEAIYQVIHWEDGVFAVENGIEPSEITITRNWSGVLLEAARRFDEQQVVEDDNLNQSTEMEFDLMAPKMDDILKEIGNEVTGYLACAVVSMDALNIAAHSREKMDLDSISAQMTLLLKLVDTTTVKINGGNLEDNLLTTKNAYFLLRFLPDKKHFLGIAADRKTAILGNMRLMSKIYADRIAKVMPR